MAEAMLGGVSTEGRAVMMEVAILEKTAWGNRCTA